LRGGLFLFAHFPKSNIISLQQTRASTNLSLNRVRQRFNLFLFRLLVAMKNLSLPCRPLLFAAILIFSITASAQTELIEDLLSLPAPTAPISYSGISPDDPEFYSYKNIPADDAPIEILLLYWARWNAVDPFYG
ncbi:MAG: hypothetical protein KC419_08500, partial [Anaerolineales bacterium]|nr:hypothetical protein [Anaerolineales bacterium]